MEVTCTECSATLSLPDHAAGKKAKCPRCETVFVVPESSGQEANVERIEEAYFKPERHDSVACPGCERWLAYTPEMAGHMVICPSCGKRSRMPAAPLRRPDLSKSQSSPVGSGQDAWSTAAPTPQPINPYAQPNSATDAVLSGYGRPAPNYNAPGWILMITSVLAGLYWLTMSGVALVAALAPNAKPDEAIAVAIQLVGALFLVALQTIIFAGALRMTQRQSLTLARTAAICAIIPCSGCCLFQLPVGIWAAVLLFNSEAKQHFES